MLVSTTITLNENEEINLSCNYDHVTRKYYMPSLNIGKECYDNIGWLLQLYNALENNIKSEHYKELKKDLKENGVEQPKHVIREISLMLLQGINMGMFEEY